jgi:membrane-associated phospholipid phosphatase
MDRRLAVILILLFVSSIALSLSAYIFGIFQVDLGIALWLQGKKNPVFFVVMSAVSFPRDWWIPAILVSAAFTICALRKKWLEAVFVVATLSSSLLTGVLKILVGRPRQPGFSLNSYDLFRSFNQYTYPSGHVLFFVVFFGFLAFHTYRYLAGWMRWIIISSCTALIMLIGPARIYLGEHWLSDVIGSYIIGTAWLIILILLYLNVLSRRSGELEG